MLYEVCYRALLSISVVEATNGRVAREGVLAHARAVPCPAPAPLLALPPLTGLDQAFSDFNPRTA